MMTCLFMLLCFPFDCGGASSCPTVRLEPSIAAEQRTNALWTATRYELSFQHGNLIVWCWFWAGCAGGDRFSSRSLRPAVGKTAHARDRQLCAWSHLRGGRSQPSSSRFHDRPSFEPSPSRRRRHALSERGAPHLAWCERGHASRRCPIARIPATPSSASRRSPTHPPRTARRNNAPTARPRTPAIRRRLPLYQKVRDRSLRIALSARTMMVNVSSSAY